MRLNWPHICARCGTTENLVGETVVIKRSKTEKGGSHKEYKSIDYGLEGFIYLCPKCDVIAKKEYEDLVAVRSRVFGTLGISVLITTIVAILLWILTVPLSLHSGLVLLFALTVPEILCILMSGNLESDAILKDAGHRRFFFDWAVNRPIRFTNRKLLESFKLENGRDVPAILVNSISREGIEMPDFENCCGGYCCIIAVILISVFILGAVFGF